MFSDFVSQPFIKFEVFTARSKCSKVNYKGKWSTIQQHRERLEKKGNIKKGLMIKLIVKIKSLSDYT